MSKLDGMGMRRGLRWKSRDEITLDYYNGILQQSGPSPSSAAVLFSERAAPEATLSLAGTPPSAPNLAT